MAKKKLCKTLPKDLAEEIKAAEASGDYSGVHAALEACELNAYGGHRKATALHMAECTPTLAEWLVGRGAHYGSGSGAKGVGIGSGRAEAKEAAATGNRNPHAGATGAAGLRDVGRGVRAVLKPRGPWV